MRAVCIDFETANGFIGSACSVGIAVIEEGKIIDTKLYAGGYKPCSIAKQKSKRA